MNLAWQSRVTFTSIACGMFLAALLAGGAVGCRQAQSQQAPPPPPPAVTVATPVAAPITQYHDFTGITEAVEVVEIRARVQGFLEEVHFEEGTEVQAGDPLYTIDPRVYQAELDRAVAELSRLKAQLSLALNEERRSARLRESRAVTEEEYVQRVAARQQAEASVQEAQASIDLAKLNLSFTDIRAPIAGRVGRTMYTAGNLVGYNDPTLLTTIVRLDPIYVVFEGTERGYLNYERKHLQRDSTGGVPPLPLFIGLEGEKGYPHEGVIDFRENRVDPGTGTIQIRATMANPHHIVLPGLFARVRLPVGEPTEQLLVPQTALAFDQRGAIVAVVDDSNVARSKAVRTGRAVGELIIIEEGLKSTDRVVINGTQKARPGSTVSPELTRLSPPPPEQLRAAGDDSATAENVPSSEEIPR